MRRQASHLILAVTLVSAFGLRVYRLDQPLFRVDEAESTVNALTILDAGYPTDHYLGLPIFENTLSQPWPESAEYEFRDSSYSSRGLAVYHAWLPLYLIAGSLKLFGIEPDHPTVELRVRHSVEWMARLSIAARLPAVLLGMAFLGVLFLLADELYGRDAAWGALLAGTFSEATVSFARQARYYSATVLFTTACCLAIWRMYRRGRPRDFVLGALVFSLLFYTHVVAFLIAGGLMAVTIAFVVKRPGLFRQLARFGAIVGGVTLPWVWATGFLTQASRIPRAWAYLKLPDDLVTFFLLRLPVSLLLMGGVLLFATAELLSRRLPARLTRPFLDRRAEFRFLIAWMVAAWVIYALLMPVASYSFERMALAMVGPGIVLAAIIVAALTRIGTRTPRPLAAGGAFLLFLVVFNGLRPWRAQAWRPHYDKNETIEFLRQHPPGRNARIYATPNNHIVFSVYTGLPVQSIAPVRREFLDSYPGEVVFIDIVPFTPPSPLRVQEAALAAGVRLTSEEAGLQAWEVTKHATREWLRPRVGEIRVTLTDEEAPAYLRPLIDALPGQTELWIREHNDPLKAFPAVFRGYRVPDWQTWWQTYFYRLVGPEARSGTNANYVGRIRNARTWLLPSAALIHVSETPVNDGRPSDRGAAAGLGPSGG